jgi:hypothetical protein
VKAVLMFITSIDREDNDGFSHNSIPRMLVALIDQTSQLGMQVIIHSPLQLGILTAADIMKSKEVIQASGSGQSEVQPEMSNNLIGRTITTADGRSRTAFQGYPTTPNSFDFSSASDHAPQTTAEPTTANQNLASPEKANRNSASPDKNALLTEIQELRARYAFTFGMLPRGRQGNIASWLHGQIQAAQYQVIDENAAAGNKPEQPSAVTHTEQIIGDARLANTLATNDRVFSTIVTRATN